jgi:chromate reductase, NAD(P)H dehydrogenase (quinone)
MSGSGSIRILGIAGSLRCASFNRAVLRTVQPAAPGGKQIDSFDTAPIPLYNEGVRQRGFPPPVEDLRVKFKSPDGLLVVTPEYNHSIPTVLKKPGVPKNAFDRASRPSEQSFDGKTAGLMGASPGLMGASPGVMGARPAQYHRRQCFAVLNGLVMNRPEAAIPTARGKFDAADNLRDQATRHFIATHLAALKTLGAADAAVSGCLRRLIHVKAAPSHRVQSAHNLFSRRRDSWRSRTFWFTSITAHAPRCASR